MIRQHEDMVYFEYARVSYRQKMRTGKEVLIICPANAMNCNQNCSLRTNVNEARQTERQAGRQAGA